MVANVRVRITDQVHKRWNLTCMLGTYHGRAVGIFTDESDNDWVVVRLTCNCCRKTQSHITVPYNTVLFYHSAQEDSR